MGRSCRQRSSSTAHWIVSTPPSHPPASPISARRVGGSRVQIQSSGYQKKQLTHRRRGGAGELIRFSHLLTKTSPGARPWLVTIYGVRVGYSNVALTNAVCEVQCNCGSVSSFRDTRTKSLHRETPGGSEETFAVDDHKFGEIGCGTPQLFLSQPCD